MSNRPPAHSFTPLEPDVAAERVIRLWSRMPDRMEAARRALLREIRDSQDALLRRVPERRRGEALKLISEKLTAFEPAEVTVAVPPERPR